LKSDHLINSFCFLYYWNDTEIEVDMMMMIMFGTIPTLNQSLTKKLNYSSSRGTIFFSHDDDDKINFGRELGYFEEVFFCPFFCLVINKNTNL